ncbi:hypothetical protein V1387_15625 [Allomuricauda taeanensis]|uniref:hypothetical protein n=1 Tax=Flagellimonas taeanensis TaxID=1005926 RepID=UPI002E7B02D1|nr:hypothetical protein [Allomuricauda taeanensis]MEE1964120.1 hypothetical protein [Allomuricauda taeanensis]
MRSAIFVVGTDSLTLSLKDDRSHMVPFLSCNTNSKSSSLDRNIETIPSGMSISWMSFFVLSILSNRYLAFT